MDKLGWYLLESSVILTFLYLLYVVVLRRETFFNLSRFFLIASVLCSLLFPLMSIDFSTTKVRAVNQSISQLTEIGVSYQDVIRELSFDQSRSEISRNVSPATTSYHGRELLAYIILILYTSGVFFCLSKVVWSLWRIRRMISEYPNEAMNGITLVRTPKPIAPFSFLKYVFVSKELSDGPHFDQILAHEKVHANQWHSLDLIFVQLFASFFWFNPICWQLVKSLKAVHEYSTDRKIIAEGCSVIEYQTVLLDQIVHNHSIEMVHNFNLSFIKKRLVMMSIPKSGLSGKVKTALTIVGALCFSALIMQCNAVMDENKSQETLTAKEVQSVKPTAIAELDDRIVIVNIGQNSRASIAEMINIINQKNPKVVGLDAFFWAPKEDVEADNMLAEALASTNNLVMVGKLKEETIETSWSNFSRNSELNYANLTVHTETRQAEVFIPKTEVEGQNVNAFAVEVAKQYDPTSVEKYLKNDQVKIDFSGNIGISNSASADRFLAIDGSDVLENTFNDSLEGKIILLGYLGGYIGQPDVLEDKFITPLNDKSEPEKPDMFGVVIHANIISQILDGR